MSDVGATIAAVLAIDPSAEALWFEDRWLSWGDLSARVAALTALYDQLGLGRGARIGIMLRNRPDQLAALLSCVASGRCLVTVNPIYPDATLAADIARLELPVLVGDASDLSRNGVGEAARERGTATIALDGAAPRLMESGDPAAPLRRTTDDVIIEMLTSGTTGAPKRVALSRAAFQTSFDAALAYEARGERAEPRLRSGTQLLVAPLTHIGGVWGAIGAFAAGRKLALLEKFRVGPWVDAVALHRPKAAGVTSAALRMILDAQVPREKLASLAILTAGAAPVAAEVIDAFLDRYDLPVLANYGATEFAGPVAGWSLPDFRAHYREKRGSAGRLHAGVEARTVDPDSGSVLSAGEGGVLELRSAQLGNGGEWLRTTDRASIDADGFIYILGRADHAIIRGGFKIQPDDVVRALETHPDVREAVVVALSDERLGQVPGAAVIARAGARPSAEELAAFARERLLPYQVPTFFGMVEDVPRTASMKPMLGEVAALLTRLREEQA